MENNRIRKAAKRWGVHLWEVANFYGCSEATLYRKLRTKLDPEEEEEWVKTIEALAKIEPEERQLHHFDWGVIT